MTTLESVFQPGGLISEHLPGYEHRPEQLEVALAVSEAIRGEKICLVEAGTGVGKTLAYLVPLVEAIREGKTVVVSTHTINLQTQLIEKDIPLVCRLFPDAGVKPALLKGRGNFLCLQDLDGAEADLFKATDPDFRKLKRWAKTTKTGDMADLPFVYADWHDVAANVDTCKHQQCRYFDRCHYYKMRKRAWDGNLFVVNHALYLTDLAMRSSGEVDGNILPDHDVVVFDEAHHLEDIATKVLGLEITNRRLPHLLDRIMRTRGLDMNANRLDSLEKLNSRLFAVFDSPRMEFFFHDVLEGPLSEEAHDLASRICSTLVEVESEITGFAKEAENELKDRLEGMARTAGRLREELHSLFFNNEPEYIRWGAHGAAQESDSGERRGRRQKPRTTLHYTPVQVGPRMEELLWSDSPCAILTSATLANSGGFEYLRSRLKIPAGAIEKVVGSPFDFRSNAMLYVPGHLPAPRQTPDDEMADAVAREIESIVGLTGGRAFLLFTSRRMLNTVHERLDGKLPFPIFRQGDMPPGKLLDAFRESGNGVLMGVQTFWEGVDVQGEALSCVIIDRLPFAVPDSPITRARTDAIKADGGDWFNDFSVPQAQIRLKQGFGRLIRTKTDRGLICILDSRLLHKAYGAEFVRFLPPASRASLWPRVERFWNELQSRDVALVTNRSDVDVDTLSQV